MDMDQQFDDVTDLLRTLHPYDSLADDEQETLTSRASWIEAEAGEPVYRAGDRLTGLYIIAAGRVEIRAPSGEVLSILGPRNSFGERGLLRDGRAVTNATTLEATRLLLVPASEVQRLIRTYSAFSRFFDRTGSDGPAGEGRPPTLAAIRVAELMSRDPVSCGPDTSIGTVAATMRDRRVSSVLIVDDERLVGLVTTRDLTNRALATGLSVDRPVREVMTADPVTMTPDALGADVLHELVERGIGHLPVVDQGKPVGMLTQTDLTRYQALSSAHLIGAVAGGRDVEEVAAAVAKVPELLAQLVGAGHRHDTVTRLITDIADAATRRLLALAEARLGPPPVPYLWLACGSQGRREQSGISDQDNCLILDDAAGADEDVYFAELADLVTSGLAQCGYYLCPGEMMASNPRWRQPLRTWKGYFSGWIRQPDPEAQMLASVMFDLRPIGGETALFENLQAETLAMASANSIFVAHMVSNSLKHTPPLSLFRGLATARSGEHRRTLDLKLQGVVPVVDLARIYALQGQLKPVNTRARLEAAAEAGIISRSGAHDLLDAYDVIATARLRHQAAQVRAGDRPDNFMAPAVLSDLERSHLRDAFVVVKTMQAALGQGRAAVR